MKRNEAVEVNILTVEEVAEELSLHPVTVRDFLRDGKITGKKIGRRWYVTRESLLRLIEGEE